MRVDLSRPFEPIRKEIAHESFGSCTLLLKPLGLAEMVAVDAADLQTFFETGDKTKSMEARILARIQQTIIGWEGIEGVDGKPLPFSWATLKRVGDQFPKFIARAFVAADSVAAGLSDTDSKNSVTPLTDSSAAAPIETTPSSNSGTDADAASN